MAAIARALRKPGKTVDGIERRLLRGFRGAVCQIEILLLLAVAICWVRAGWHGFQGGPHIQLMAME
jgi:hypothetical protein